MIKTSKYRLHDGDKICYLRLFCFYDCVQHVVKIGFSVTQVAAFRRIQSAMVSVIVETSPMNETAVSA